MFRLRDADMTLRLFITTFLVVLTVGYMIGLFFIDHQTAITPTGVQEQFLGTDEAATELRYAKSANEMFVFLHNHILSLALVFGALGTVFYFSSIVSDGWKRFLIIEPLLAVVTTFGGIALLRYVSPHFSWLVMVSGASLFLCYSVMVVIILRELWWPPRS